MKKISLALIASFIAAPLCATSAMTAAPVVSAKKTSVVAVPLVDMNAAAPVAVSALPSASPFGGVRVTIGGEYDVNFADSYVSVGELAMAVPNKIGKSALDVGYTKVLGNNIILGGSFFGAYAPTLEINKEGSNLVVLDDEGAVLRTYVAHAGSPSINIGRKWLTGLKLNAGMVVMPSVVVKLIGEVSGARYVIADEGVNQASGNYLITGAIGAGLDIAVTDRVLFGIGAKYNFVPKSFDATTTGAPISVQHFGKSMSIFAEIGYRLTQD